MVKTALITGASTGIGYELAKVFAKDGNELVLVARDARKLEQVAEEMRGIFGKPVRIIAADRARPESAADIYRQVGTTVIDYLVNNAGFGLGGGFVNTELQTELDMMQVNMVSLVHLTSCSRGTWRGGRAVGS